MRKWISVLLTIAAASAVVACGDDSSSDEASTTTTAAGGGLSGTYDGPEAEFPASYPVPKRKPGTSPTVALLLVANNESNVALLNAAKAQANKLDIRLIALNDNADVDRQVTNFNQAIAQNADAIIYYPLDPKALRRSIADASAQDISIFALDAMNPGQPLPEGLTSTILFARDQSAFLQVQEMAKRAPKAKVGVIGFQVPVPGIEYYISRVRYWAKRAGLQVVGRANNRNDDVPGGEQAMTELMSEHDDLQGIIAYNDPSALGAATAARAAGRRLTIIGLNGGSDGRAGVEQGRIDATVEVKTPVQAVEFLNGAYQLAAEPGGTLPTTVSVPAELVTKDTLADVKSYDQLVDEIRSSSTLVAPR